LVDDFIFLVMLETGEAMNAFRWERIYFTGLRSMLETIVYQLTPLARQHNVHLEAEIAQSLPGTVLHVDYIKGALERLIDNAIKFSQQAGGHVLVRATADDEWIYIAVQDSGVGIAATEIPFLFKRLHQLRREQLEQQGVGVGLSIVKGIVDIHGGRVEVESQLGQGSTFTLALPITREEFDPRQ
jgi:signal transduction histidine kinase